MGLFATALKHNPQFHNLLTSTEVWGRRENRRFPPWKLWRRREGAGTARTSTSRMSPVSKARQLKGADVAVPPGPLGGEAVEGSRWIRQTVALHLPRAEEPKAPDGGWPPQIQPLVKNPRSEPSKHAGSPRPRLH